MAAAVLERSPVLTDADLAHCARSGDADAQTALARRPNLPPRATAALVEIGQRDAVLALIGNAESDLSADLLHRILTRFGEDTSLREALLERPALPASVRARIAVAAAKDLAVEASEWMAPERAQRIAREARDQALCTIASSCRPDERAELTRTLRATGSLTPALLHEVAAWRRTGSVRRGFGGIVGPAAAARRRLHPRAAGRRLRRARPPRRPEERRFARLSRRARRDQDSCRRAWRRAQTQAGAKGHRRMRAAQRSRAYQGSGAAVALRRRSGEGGSRAASRARRLLRLQAVVCRRSWTFLQSTTTSIRRGS